MNEERIADVEAALRDVVDTVRTIDGDPKHWRNNLCVRLDQLRFYVRRLRPACELCEGTGRYGDGKHDGSGRWIEYPNCPAPSSTQQGEGK